MKGSSKSRLIILEIFLIIIAIIYLYPIILVLYNSFKSFGEILVNIIALPKKLEFTNYIGAWNTLNYARSFLNTLIITLVGTAGIVLIGALGGYKLSRNNTKLSWAIFAFCNMPMMIPLQSTMITLVQEAKVFHLTGNIVGTAFLYWGLNSPFVLFLYYGFAKSIPVELDEAAKIDGCNSLQTFIRIVFPIMKPLTITVIVMNVTLLWNDFLLPLLTLSSNENSKTLQLAAYGFFGQYISEWNLALAGAIMIITPSMIFFLLLQKHIMKGVAAGSVKG